MAIESVEKGDLAVPTVPVPAHELFKKFTVANSLSDKLHGAKSVLAVLSETFIEDTPLNGSVHAVSSMIEEAYEMANSLQWSYDVGGRAERAMSQEG